MNPDLSLDELNLIAERLANNRNSLAMDDFCGLSPNQIQNWLYAPVANLNGVTVSTPADFSDSPVELGVTRITATKYLEQLVEHGFLKKQRIGRANYYINEPLCALLMAQG